MLHFLHWYYTWTALLLANQNWVIFSCILLDTIILISIKLNRFFTNFAPYQGSSQKSHKIIFPCCRSALRERNDLRPFHEYPLKTDTNAFYLFYLSSPNSKSTRNIDISVLLLITNNNSVKRSTWGTSFKYWHIVAYRYQYCSRRYNTQALST